MKPTPRVEECRKLWSLIDDGKWHKARTIAMNSRMIRAICSAKPDHFLSTQKGYKLVKFATDSEIEIAVADLRSRMKHLNARASSLEHELLQRSNRRLF